MIDRREAIAAMRFPADFSRDVGAGRPALAQVILDGRRANSGQITLGYLNAIAAGMGARARARRRAGHVRRRSPCGTGSTPT